MDNQNNSKQKILIIGGGGREHAIGWKLKQSSKVEQIFFAPGNAGTRQIGTNIDIAVTDIPKLIEYAQKEKIDLTVALPDDPLALGIVDEFNKKGLRIWGPTKAAAQIEWSKVYSKNFMERHNLPTAKFKTFTDYEEAKKYVENQMLPLVIKANGLALGKGVIICETKEDVNTTLENIFIKKIFGNAGNEIIIEKFLSGPEISIHAFSDGKNYKIFPPSQDHKRVWENNLGPNTGGMGTIAPLPFVTRELLKDIDTNIVSKTILGMNKDGNTFQGVIYPGLMLTKDGPQILEYNARFGDPEAQTYMRLLDTDLIDILNACIDRKLDAIEVKWKDSFACNIVLASGGYPNEYQKGKIITGIEDAEMDRDIVVFHAGTKLNEKKELVTNGGRVLGVSATGATLEEALNSAYKAIKKISFEGMHYRKDIGRNTLAL